MFVRCSRNKTEMFNNTVIIRRKCVTAIDIYRCWRGILHLFPFKDTLKIVSIIYFALYWFLLETTLGSSQRKRYTCFLEGFAVRGKVTLNRLGGEQNGGDFVGRAVHDDSTVLHVKLDSCIVPMNVFKVDFWSFEIHGHCT